MSLHHVACVQCSPRHSQKVDPYAIQTIPRTYYTRVLSTMGIDSTVWSGRQIETRTTRFLDSVPFYGHKHARFGFRVLVVYANYTEISTISTRTR